MGIVLANNAHTTLAANISSTDTTIYVDDVDSFPSLGVDEYFYCTIESTTGTYEIVKVTQTNATNFIVTRGQESTIPVPFNIGARVELRVTVQSMEDLLSGASVGPQGPQGPAGADGANGADGADGVGVPAGGTTGQSLVKASNDDFDTEWTTISGGASVDDTVYGADWNGVTDTAPSQNAVYDKINSLAQADITGLKTSDTPTFVSVAVTNHAYDSSWNGSNEAPTKNAVFDKIETIVGVTDGDKGDVNVSGSGTTWTIDNDAVTYAKMQNVSATSRVLGRITSGAGDVEELTAANLKTILALAQADISGLTTASSPSFTAVTVNGSAYGSGWNGSNNVPTRNDVYDRIEQIAFHTFEENGAVGDGTTDDLSAINTTITAAAASGKPILAMAKTYAVSATIAWKAGVRLIGAGCGQYPLAANVASSNFTALKKTRILAKSGFAANTPVISCKSTADDYYAMHNVHIDGIMIDCATIADYGLDVISVKHSTFRNILVFRPDVRGILEDCLTSSVTGTAQAGASTTITLQANAASTRDDLYNGQTITITGGTGSGQSKTITDYVGSTQVATVNSSWSVTPNATSTYSITGDNPTESNGDTQFNVWENVTVWANDTGSSAIGWQQYGTTIANINGNQYNNCLVVHKNGTGLDIRNADRQTIVGLNTISTGTGVGVVLWGNEKNISEYARNVKLIAPELAPSGGTGGLLAKAGAAVSSRYNCAVAYSGGNGSPQPTIEAGAGFWYNTDGNCSEWQSFTPTVTFSTPGDLSVSYSVQYGRWKKNGRTVDIDVFLVFTPTYTTASGTFLIAGLPYTVGGSAPASLVIGQGSLNWTYGTSCTWVTANAIHGTTQIQVYGHGSNISDVVHSVTQWPSGTSKTIRLSGRYEANQ